MIAIITAVFGSNAILLGGRRGSSPRDCSPNLCLASARIPLCPEDAIRPTHPRGDAVLLWCVIEPFAFAFVASRSGLLCVLTT
jgi:hypothetical protein